MNSQENRPAKEKDKKQKGNCTSVMTYWDPNEDTKEGTKLNTPDLKTTLILRFFFQQL